MDYAAFASYVLLMVFAPGANTITAMSGASRGGFMGAMPFCAGLFLGTFVIECAAALFCSFLYGFIPQIQPAMTLLCAAYILWTAWSVWRSGDEPAPGGSGAFLGGIAMQFLNAGVILCAVTSFSVFILPHHDDARVIALFAFAIAAAGFVSACCWAAFGAALEKFFRARRRLLNGAMALLLVWCALSQLAALAR